MIMNTLTKSIFLLLFSIAWMSQRGHCQSAQIKRMQTLDSLGAAQGISSILGDYYVYGDREVGMMRRYHFQDSLHYTGDEYLFTVEGKDFINHPTGIAWDGQGPAFIGNSTRLNEAGTLWKAEILVVDLTGFLKTKTLDGNLISSIEDDACIQGTRPEYVQYQGQQFVATADYGPKNNEVRLYDPKKLISAKKTSENGVLVGKFSCSPWVQNLHWIPEEGVLVLIQNQIEGRLWRLTFLDLEASMASGKEVILRQIDLDPKDELEGFCLLPNKEYGIGVSSSRKNNVALINLHQP